MAPLDLLASGNRLLAALAPRDLALIVPELEPIDLPLRYVLETPGKPIKHVYFVDRGMASVVSGSRKPKRAIEIGMIGREGMSGHAVVMGNHQSPNATYMQMAGAGRRLRSEALRAAFAASSTLQGMLLKSVQIFLTQTAQTAVSNANAKIEERLARWLLMAHDRAENESLPLTHEFLSVMLGVRRAGVTIALHALEERGVIRSRRGEIVIANRIGMERFAGESYGIPESESARLFAVRPAPVPRVR